MKYQNIVLIFKVYNIKLCDIDSDYRKKDNPFEVKSKHQ